MAAPLARQLADSTDKRVRARAVAALRTFLSTAPAEEDEVQNLEWDAAEPQDARFSRLEMEKLQKALFYAFFHCDKPIPQQTLADTLSKLMLDINAGSDAATFKAACSYYRAFWTILVKEWSNIDRLRMDKYLMLIRKYVTAAFKLLARVEWRAEAVKEHNLILQEIPLQSDGKVPLSLSAHLASVYLSCLESAVQDVPSHPIPLVHLLDPFVHFLCHAPKTHCKLVTDELIVPVLDLFAEQVEQPKKRRKFDKPPAESSLQTAALAHADGQPLEASDLRALLLKVLFDRASEEATPQANRQRLYRLYEDKVLGDAKD